MTKSSDKHVGIRFLFLLIPLFAAVVCAAFAVSYPGQITAALDNCNYPNSLANPQLTVSGIAVPDDALISDVIGISDCNPAVCYDAQTADGKKIRLINIGYGAVTLALHMTDGYPPQLTPYECAVVALSPNAAPALGTVIRPCDENGEALLSADGTPSQLTVVCIGENIHSALSPISDPAVDYLVYTVSDEAWHAEDAVNCLLLDDCRTDDPYADVQALYQKHADAQTAYLAAQTEAQRTELLTAAEEADNAVLAQEIALQNLDNRLDTANLRVSELENRMMDAIALLQAEQQQFVSDMEYNEYYALRQVDLIPRRDRAEEGYAKQEAAIDAINEELHTAYAERNQIAEEHTAAEQTLSALQESADAAHAALESLNQQVNTAHPWDIVLAEQHPAYVILNDHASSVRQTALIGSIIAAAVFLIGSIAVYASGRCAVWSAARLTVTATLTSVPAAMFGSSILTNTVFSYHFPALTDTIKLPVFSAMVPIAGLLLLTAAFSFLTARLGIRIHRRTAVQK